MPIVAQDHQRNKQRSGVLPAIENPTRQELTQLVGYEAAEYRLVAEGAYQLPHDVERGEIGDHQNGKAAQVAEQVPPEVGLRTALQPKPHGHARALVGGRARVPAPGPHRPLYRSDLRLL